LRLWLFRRSRCHHSSAIRGKRSWRWRQCVHIGIPSHVIARIVHTHWRRRLAVCLRCTIIGRRGR
jgi:hypothetical protein